MQRPHDWVSYPEVKKTIENVKDPELQAFMAIMYAVGARVGELSYGFRHEYGIYERKPFYLTDERGNKIMKKEKVQISTKIITSNGMKKKHVREDARSLNLRVPNFKYKKMRWKNGYISKKAEPWLCNIILNYIKDMDDEEFLFKHRKNYYQQRIFKQWDYTTHTLRKSRGTHLHFDVGISLRAIADMLGHADLSQLMTYLKTPPQEYLDKMEKAELPGVK